MKHLITSRPSKQGQRLVVLALVVVALALLLGMGDGWPGTASQALAQGTTLRLPFIAKSNLVFFDDFSNSSSGWPHRRSFEDCYFEYRNGVYRVEIDDEPQRCIIPNFNIPKQIQGTFIVKMRRTSSEDSRLFYGLIFGASTNAIEDRWELLLYPNNDSKCSNKPFYWLFAYVDGDQKEFEDLCTDSIDTDEDDWNELKIIRTISNGDNRIRVYINGQAKGDWTDGDGRLINEGYTLLEVATAGDSNIVVEFDDFRILNTTTP